MFIPEYKAESGISSVSTSLGPFIKSMRCSSYEIDSSQRVMELKKSLILKR